MFPFFNVYTFVIRKRVNAAAPAGGGGFQDMATSRIHTEKDALCDVSKAARRELRERGVEQWSEIDVVAKRGLPKTP